MSQKNGDYGMREIIANLLDEDYEKLQNLAMKLGFHNSNDLVRKIVEEYIQSKRRVLK